MSGAWQKGTSISGMAIGVVLALVSFALPTPEPTPNLMPEPMPDRKIDYSEVFKYVGGDAYNIQIEATIRSGEIAGAKAEIAGAKAEIAGAKAEIAGAKTVKAVFLVGGVMLFGMSLIAFGFSGVGGATRPPSSPEL